jgi:hypothetical protein
MPCRYVISGFDYFDHKEEVINMLKKIPEIQDGETFSNALLAMRFFIAEQLQEPNPLSFSDEKDIEFFDYYLSYLS